VLDRPGVVKDPGINGHDFRMALIL
jgi:hypothetical protein